MKMFTMVNLNTGSDVAGAPIPAENALLSLNSYWSEGKKLDELAVGESQLRKCSTADSSDSRGRPHVYEITRVE